MKIEDLKAGTWANLEVAVLELWDSVHPTIRQAGLFIDDTGIVKFVSWERSNHPLLQEGAIYKINSMPVSQFEDKLGVTLVSTTTITRLGKKEDTQAELPVV